MACVHQNFLSYSNNQLVVLLIPILGQRLACLPPFHKGQVVAQHFLPLHNFTPPPPTLPPFRRRHEGVDDDRGNAHRRRRAAPRLRPGWPLRATVHGLKYTLLGIYSHLSSVS